MNTSMSKKIVYLLICLGNFTISFNVAAISAVIPVISKEFELSDFLVARIVTFYLIPYGIGALVYAPLTKKFSYKQILIGAMVLYSISCFVCAQTQSLPNLIIGRIFMGITAASAIPMGLMVIGDVFEKKFRGRLVGIFFSCSFISSLLGVFLSGVIGWRCLFLVPAIMALVLIFGYFLLSNHLLDKVHGRAINYLKVFENVAIKKIFLFIFALSFLYHGVHKWYGVYLSQVYNFDMLQISLYFAIVAIAGLFGQLVGGFISDKYSRLTACYIGIVGISVSIFLLKGGYSSFALGGVLFLISLFWTIGHNGISTVLTDFPDEDRPAIASLNSSVRFISGGLGFYLSGFFVTRNFDLTFSLISILIILLTYSINRVIPKHNK
jgi:predicted MFS family arabinose efflux permease